MTEKNDSLFNVCIYVHHLFNTRIACTKSILFHFERPNCHLYFSKKKTILLYMIIMNRMFLSVRQFTHKPTRKCPVYWDGPRQ